MEYEINDWNEWQNVADIIIELFWVDILLCLLSLRGTSVVENLFAGKYFYA